jgi:hypothetical protein
MISFVQNNLLSELAEHGLFEDDIIEREEWFLSDLLKAYSGDMGATMTPGENMNLLA